MHHEADKKKYALESYKPNKNAVPVMYNGVEYASKKQCMVLNDLSRKDLDEYLKGKAAKEAEKEAEPVVQEVVKEILVD